MTSTTTHLQALEAQGLALTPSGPVTVNKVVPLSDGTTEIFYYGLNVDDASGEHIAVLTADALADWQPAEFVGRDVVAIDMTRCAEQVGADLAPHWPERCALAAGHDGGHR